MNLIIGSYCSGREERYGDRRDRDRRDRARERERERERERDRDRERNGEDDKDEKLERIPHADRNLEEKAIKVRYAEYRN